MTNALRAFLEKIEADIRPKSHDRITAIDDANKALKLACAKLGYPPFTHHDFRHFFATTCIGFHDLRHYFISFCVISGVDFMTIAKWVGHQGRGNSHRQGLWPPGQRTHEGAGPTHSI